LREALWAIKATIPSIEGILHAAARAGCKVPISRAGLDQFIRAETKNLSERTRVPLEKFVFQSPLGRALRAPLAEEAPAPWPLANQGIDISGLYWLYHGSYLRAGLFSIKVLEIRRVDGQASAARLIRKDNLTGTSKQSIFEARGQVVFFPLRIVLEASDTRLGHSLLAAGQTDLSPARDRLEGFKGTLSGVTRNGLCFQRVFAATRPSALSAGNGGTPPSHEEALALMIGQTGLFRHEELAASHREAVDHLTAVAPDLLLFSDPVLEWTRSRPTRAD
jgi:hypothetical protein